MSLFLPGTASLIESLDRKVTVVLRDGRNLVGIFRSFDQPVHEPIWHSSGGRPVACCGT